MPQDAKPSQRNQAARSDFHCLDRAFAAMPLSTVVVLPVMLYVMVRLGLNRVRACGRRWPLVFLSGAGWPHRHFETRRLSGIGCRGKRWKDDGESTDGDQARGATKQYVHEHELARENCVNTF